MLKNLNFIQLGLYYLLKFFDRVDDWLTRAEYEIGNFFDPPKPPKKGEKTNDWCNRITADQALRYAKYFYKSTRELKELLINGDISVYKYKKDRELLKKFISAALKMVNYNEDLYKRMLLRKQLENRSS